MPKKTNLKKVLVIGSGPIIIGQAAEFDYSGTQAVQSLKEEGLEVVLINSNPATIMTDAETADKVYIEPLTREFLLKVIYAERPDGILASLGGQTALNLAMDLAEEGVLEREGIELLGAKLETIKNAEDRDLFRKLMAKIGEPTPESTIAHTVNEAIDFAKSIGYPIIIRPAFTLGGTGGGIAYNETDLRRIANSGIQNSPIKQVLVERSIAGFKEIEYEVMRDSKDNCIIICNMENFDPVGVHTGDSIVFAPSQTLSDRDHQMLRSSALKIIRSLGIEGGCNVQYALDPHSFQYHVIEVNPRVSRSSALASKATGYPIAKMAAKIAIGMGLDEIINPVTKKTYACFEPALDYIITKIPRWPFDKFTTANKRLGTQMKATGEVMSIGRTIEESLLKSVRSLEIGTHHIELPKLAKLNDDELALRVKWADDERLFSVAEALRRNWSVEKINELSEIDPFFLYKIKNIIDIEKELASNPLSDLLLKKAKSFGMTDKAIAFYAKSNELEIEKKRNSLKLHPVFKMVDTCAAEFESKTPYYYSTYENEDEVIENGKKKVVVLGSGPIRIGQGIEFDYATVHAVKAIQEAGLEAIIINNNPETVSTDFSTSDRLYFEPLYLEDVVHILDKEKPEGVVVQFGGQTAINLAGPLHKRGYKILGTSVENIDKAEDRKKFEVLLKELNIAQPIGTAVTSKKEALEKTKDLGFPVIVRPSYVIGGRAMEIVYNEDELGHYMETAVQVTPDHPVLIDRYMIGKEVEVDAICDGDTVLIPGIMEHIERAGVHSGDSMAVYPPQDLSPAIRKDLEEITIKLSRALQISGLINIQFVIKKDQVYVLEVNPRSSRTIPFLSKVTKIPMARVAMKAIIGQTLKTQGYKTGVHPEPTLISIKAPVFSFAKLHDVDIALGPEMKSTGEVMGTETTFLKALRKAFIASGMKIPTYGVILATIADKHKEEAIPIMKLFHQAGFTFISTEGTAKALSEAGIPSKVVSKIGESPNDVLSVIEKGHCDLVINSITKGKQVESDGFQLRRKSVEHGILCLTSLDTAHALAQSIMLHSMSIAPLERGPK